jgi:hypothetical protein
MSQWGNKDRRETGLLASINNDSNVVTILNTGNVGNSTSPFTAANGFIVGNKLLVNANVINLAYNQNTYAIASILTSNTLTLDAVYSGSNTTVGNIAIQESPKNIFTYGLGTKQGNATVVPGRSQNTITARNVYGIDRVEANTAGARANGINMVGWVHYKTWTTTQGSVRHRVEPLVAMSKNFNANATGVLNQTDAFDMGTPADRIAPNS